MKKKNHIPAKDMRPEYDFASMKGGVRGKYARRRREGTNTSDRARGYGAFPTEQAVNEALKGFSYHAEPYAVQRLPNKALQPTSRQNARLNRSAGPWPRG